MLVRTAKYPLHSQTLTNYVFEGYGPKAGAPAAHVLNSNDRRQAVLSGPAHFTSDTSDIGLGIQQMQRDGLPNSWGQLRNQVCVAHNHQGSR